MNKFRLRFWFWHQEIIINDITADELITSMFFPLELDLEEHPSFSRDVYVRDVYNPGGEEYKISVTFDDKLEKLVIGWIKKGTDDIIDTRMGTNGWDMLGDDKWILERM